MPGLGVIGHANFLHRAWRYRLRTERDELAYMRSLDLAGRTLVDIGAHRGLYSYWMSKAAGRRGRVVSFEPQPEMLEAFKAAVPIKRMIRPEEVAAVAVFLASDDASYINGQTWAVDGGYTMI